ncbi:hypothetical protein BSL78_18063 [Apostichopus japonicus]|uniref:Ig-like domain-containing protein n=1 Tax=Stichopus japonicus TaxID=307972 RepID=A0A2G8KAN7_STIJA|nr:hypothetical protein BSL78_18063 [Apostichopus japonicus]
MDVVLRFQLVLFVCSGFHDHGFSDTNISANKHDNVTLNCSLGIDVTPSEQKWNYNGQAIYNKDQVLWLRKSARIQPPHYTLIMNNVSISDEGTYQCSSGTRFVIYQLSVNVSPKSFNILSGDFNLTDGDYLPIKMNQTEKCSCNVIGVRPKNNIKWFVNNVEYATDINYRAEDTVDQGTFNIHSSFQFQPQTVSGTLTCARTTTDSALLESTEVRFSADVLAKLYLLVDGIGGLKDSYIEGDVIWIICKAFGSRTKIELAITVNNATLSPAWKKKMTSFDEEKQTYNVTMEVRFYTIEKLGTIACSCKANGCHGNPRLERNFYMLDKDQTSKIDSSNDLLLILSCFLGSFSIAICIMFACFKARSMPHENCASRRLPEIPNDEGDSGEHAYYSDSKEIDSKTQMFKLQDVCVLTKLNFGALYKRWTGTLTHKDNLNKCIVIITESGKNETNKRLHWNAFVRRLLELPANSKNLVGTEGIYIDGGTSFPGRDKAISDWSYRANLSDCSTTNCELRDELLLRCWQTDVAKRPSILELRKSYEQISSQSDLQSSYMTMS